MSNPAIFVIHPVIRYKKTAPPKVASQEIVAQEATNHKPVMMRSDEEQLREICALAEAIDLEIVQAEITSISSPHPATLLSHGVILRLSEQICEQNIELVVLNATISASQHRNLENQLGCKLLDRTTLILEIFGARAQSREGGWQVELAALEWQRSRLVKSWTHLERQRGGAGFMGGPGERQLEIDRRLLSQKIEQLHKRIAQFKKMRSLQRRTRKQSGHPIIALTGYTNTGKSTLFNQMSHSDYLAKDMLFATLETKSKNITLPSGRQIILSDTIGFVSDLPHMLVEAFRATLEEVREADILLHVREIAAADFEQQGCDVDGVLKQIFADEPMPPICEIWNKADKLTGERYQECDELAQRNDALLMSAHAPDDITKLLHHIDRLLDGLGMRYQFLLNPDEGKLKAWLYNHGHVLREIMRDDGKLQLEVVLSKADYGKLQKQLVVG